MISLNIVVLPKTGGGPEQAPLFDFQGGPGVPATSDAALFASDLRLHRVRRAVVMIDQRGTGASNPLHCPTLEEASPLEDIYVPEAVRACASALTSRADLSQYTTEASAHDIDAVREALGYPQIDLMGLSYGTMMEQAYMKIYGKRVRAAVFIGTAPLGEKLPLHHAINAEHVLRDTFRDCHADPNCGAAYPDLERDWSSLLHRLEAQPAAGNGRTVLREGPFLEALRGTMASVDALREMPAAIHEAALGNFAPILKMLPKQEGSFIPEGMYLSVTCPSALEISQFEIARESKGTSFGAYRTERQIAACRLWPAAAPSEALEGPVVSNVPVLLVAGGRDAVTPLSWARQVSSTLPNSRIVEIGPLTHLPVDLSNAICMDQVMDAFYAKGSAEGLDISCVATMKPPPFVTVAKKK